MQAVARDVAELVQQDRLEVDLRAARWLGALLPPDVGAEDEVALEAAAAAAADDRHAERLARDLRGREADLRAAVAEDGPTRHGAGGVKPPASAAVAHERQEARAIHAGRDA